MKFDFLDTALLTEAEIQKEGARLLPYIDRVKGIIFHSNYDEPEASLILPGDETYITLSQALANQMNADSVRVLFVIGIGGSNLGTKAVYDALIGHFSAIETRQFPRVVFLDTINPSYISQMKAYLAEHDISQDQYLITVITKSGTTSETIMNMELLMTLLPDALSRLVVITDDNSKLEQMAQSKNIPVLNIPRQVGGRYSVFSNVGLFPLTVLGVDTKKLLEGAFDAREKSTSEEILRNPAAISAIILYALARKGYIINDNFFFNAELESVGKWYRQLMGESIGKNGKGILPTVSIGSVDLHSMVQLYLGGPKNIYTTFYWSGRNAYHTEEEPHIPSEPAFAGLVPDINGKTASHVLHTILKGTQKAYKKNSLPYSEMILEDISEFNLGKLMQFKMIEMMYLGFLFGIDTFTQPNVEDYKEETRKLLSS